MQLNLSHLHEVLPPWLGFAFTLTTLTLLTGLYSALRHASSKKAPWLLAGIVAWLILIGVLAANDFFLNVGIVPPRFIIVILPPVMFIVGLLCTRQGQQFVDQLPLRTLTLIHTVRVPVELVIYTFFVYQQVPELMTFEGRNFDILPGLTAPLIAFLAFNRRWLSNKGLLVWNLVSLVSLANIVTNAILASPVPFQLFGFEQPNVAVLKFPFIWLPGFIVPLVLFCHLVAIRRLIGSRKNISQSSQAVTDLITA